ncbi:hypothetical protein DENIS_1181 [Desulfonema ishimotonii]|uniref:LamG-like jellyroll fold domain-containing protein n=1 Tax=Desulfonema ishimotonii TaxID=45657 RepID=A0A401FTF1_9BACT|nr:LamG domain-containing protein [Desulfonema ishimotonii]GBC60230.1 hypothetical protein DENIS_1181 [Desulfonema ishimotonii]
MQHIPPTVRKGPKKHLLSRCDFYIYVCLCVLCLCGIAHTQSASNALRFDGEDAYVLLGKESSLNLTGPLTLEAWIRPTGWGEASQSGFGRILDKSVFLLFLNKTGSDYPEESVVFFMQHENGTGSGSGSPPHTIQLGTWQHIAVSYDGNGTVRLYINGVARSLSQPIGMPAGPIADNSWADLFLGESSGMNRAFEGDIGEVRIWNTVRTPAQILAHFKAGINGDESGLAGYWPMNATDPETLRDRSGNGNDGTIFRATWTDGPDFNADTDGDGVPDTEDECPSDPDKSEPGDCGCGVPDTDTDGDGVSDCLDADGDGVPDTEDECPSDPDKSEPGDCGCGIPDTDTDGDSIPDCLDPSAPPDRPRLAWPTDGLIRLSLTPELRTRDFSDPDATDRHAQTHWQISRASDFSSLIFDRTSDLRLTRLTVPRLILEEGQAYYWRVRFSDSQGDESGWAAPSVFITQTTGSDTDSDGVPDAQETGTDTDLDGNGVADSGQADMLAVKTLTGQAAIRASVAVSSLAALMAVDPADIGDTENRPDQFPLGLIGFRLETDYPGALVQVLAYFSEPLSDQTGWYRYDRLSGWQDESVYARLNGRGTLVLNITDGGTGDADGVENGIIVQIAGPDEIVPPAPAPSADSGSDGGGGGCFINTASARQFIHQ